MGIGSYSRVQHNLVRTCMQWDFSWYTLKFYWCLPYRVDSSLDPVYPKSSGLSIVAPYVGRWVPVEINLMSFNELTIWGIRQEESNWHDSMHKRLLLENQIAQKDHQNPKNTNKHALRSADCAAALFESVWIFPNSICNIEILECINLSWLCLCLCLCLFLCRCRRNRNQLVGFI